MKLRLSPLKFFDFLALALLSVFFVFLPMAKKQSPAIPKLALTSTLLLPHQNQPSQPFPEVSAQSVYIYDPDSGSTLYEKNSSSRFYPASTTKLMTALVAVQSYDLDQVLTVKSGGNALGQSLHLTNGDQFTVENLLYGLLVDSGNDTGVVLAENFPGGYTAFVAKMNQKATEMGLTNTRFTNVTGLVNPDHYTSTRDLTVIAAEAIKSATIRKITSTKSVTITNIKGTRKYSIESTNKLLGLDGVKGLKTGWTPESGECLVTLVTRDGHSVIVTILNSTDRFGESKKIIDWVYRNFTWQKI